MKFSTPFHFLFSQLFEDTERERDNIVWRIRVGAPVWPVVRYVQQAEAMWTMFRSGFVGMPVARVDHRTTLEADYLCHDNALHRVLLNNISPTEITRINNWLKVFDYDYSVDEEGVIDGFYTDGSSASGIVNFRDYGTAVSQNKWYSDLHDAGFIPEVFHYTVGANRLIKIFSDNLYAYELPGSNYDDDGNSVMGFIARGDDLVADYVEMEDDNKDDTE